MSRLSLVLRRAGTADFAATRTLIGGDVALAEGDGRGQWATPGPDENGRNERIFAALAAGRTWIAWDGDRPVATLTASPNHHGIWPEELQHDRAVYVRRLTVSRRYGGIGLGSQLMDWAGMRASHEYGARFIRVNVWTTNTGLHEYYRREGFQFCGLSPLRGYPSAALFQKPTLGIQPPADPLFCVAADG